MNIEKIKNYNQKVLAVLGSLAVLFVIYGLVMVIIFTIREFRMSHYEEDSGILSEDKIEELKKENKREQVISYNTPRLVDTLNQIYIIPVTHKTLNEPEDIDELLGLMNASSSAELRKTDYRYSKNYYGDYNNVLIYDQKSGKSQKLFDKRVNFDNIKTEYFKDDVLLLLSVAESDTFRDGVINLRDFSSLYLYSLKKQALVKVAIEGTDVVDYSFLDSSKDLVVRFGIDKNDNGKYEAHNEPTILKKYSFSSGTLSDIVAPM